MKGSHHKQLSRRKRRIERRLKPRNWNGQDSPMIRGGARHVEVSDRIRATEFGGVSVIHQMVQGLGLDRSINDHVEVFQRHLPYWESDHVLNLAYNVLTGGQRIEDIDRLREDESFLDLIGAQRIPDPTTAGDFLRRLGEDEVIATLAAINVVRRDRVWTKLTTQERKRAIIDTDGSYVPTTGEKKRGMEFTRKGGWGYHALVLSLANTQEVLYVVNRSGNVVSHDGAAPWMDRAIELCRERFEEVLLRGDTDFSLTRNFDRWTESGVKFVFGYDAKQNLVAAAEALPADAWTVHERAVRIPKTSPRQRRENTKEDVVIEREFENQRLIMEWRAEIPYRPGNCARTYRMVILKKDLNVEKGQQVLFEQTKYFFYITNDESMSAVEVIGHANRRCHQENLIEQLKNGVPALRSPVHDLNSNWAYMVCASLAWNLKAWFAILQRRQSDRQSLLRMEFKRFMQTVVRVVCQVVRTRRQVRVRILSYTTSARLLLLDVSRMTRAG